jgi:hypothetical protein
MKKEPDTKILAKKPYAKPSWQKQTIFERFTLACSGQGRMKATPVAHCRAIGS